MSFNTESRFTRAAATGTSTATQGTTRYRTVKGGTTTVAVVNGILFWRRIRAALAAAARRVGETVSPAGWLLISALVLGLGAGLIFGWIEFVVAGVVAGALLACSIPFLFGARAYDVQFQLFKDRVVAGTEARGEIRVTNIGGRMALPGRVDLPMGEGIIEVEVPWLRAKASHAEELVIAARKRDVIDVGPARTVRGDPLGILRRENTWEDKYRLFIHPRTTVLPSTSTGFIRDLEGNPSVRIVNDDLSFHAIREYQAGDSRRQVHWKSTAKTGKLMVRQYEETRRSHMVVALASGQEEYRDADEFELAVSAAASVSVRGIRDGRDLQVVMGGEIPEFARASMRSLRELTTINIRAMLDDFSGIKLSDRVNSLAEVCELVTTRSSEVSIAFLVCGSTMTAQQLRTTALAFPSDIAVIAIVCDPHAEPSVRRLGDITVISIGLLDDLRHLLVSGVE